VQYDAAVRPDVARFLEMLAASGAPPLDSLPPVEMRAAAAALRGFDLPPVPLEVVQDIRVPGPAGDIPARLYDPREEREAGPLLLFFHGGGFVFGDLESHHSFCTWLAGRFDLPVLAVDYRLAPEYPFPAAVEDVEAVARWAAGSPAELGRRVGSLLSCGDSAGGNLAIALAGILERQPAAVPLAAQIAIYPYCGGGSGWPSYQEFGEGYLLTRDAMNRFEHYYDAPENDIRCNCFAGPPPRAALAMLTAGLDPLRDAGRHHAELAGAAGARVLHQEAQGMIHGFVTVRAALPSCMDDLDAFADEARALTAQAVADLEHRAQKWEPVLRKNDATAKT